MSIGRLGVWRPRNRGSTTDRASDFFAVVQRVQTGYIAHPASCRTRDSSVGIATHYWLDGPGIESRWEERVSAPVQTGCEAHRASYTMGTGSFPGVKWPGRCVDHTPPSSAEVKERVELYLCSSSGPSWPVLGWSLPLPLPLPSLLFDGYQVVYAWG
jgi:hypothetical protein